MPPNDAEQVVSTVGPVLIIGTGLIGTSIGLALQSGGVPVYLSDPSPTSLALAIDMGAGLSEKQMGHAQPRLVVVAAPPDVAAQCVIASLERFPDAIVTDVASVKSSVGNSVASAAQVDLTRYIGSHPMAGRARSGASYADKDLFYGQPWVIVPTVNSHPEGVLAIRNLAVDLGAVPTEMDPAEHDQAVAYISHVPQIISSLLAARLLEAPESALNLAGGGLRDTTRIAASDPRMWTAIIAGNAEPIAKVLDDISSDLSVVVERLNRFSDINNDGGSNGAIGIISEVISAGNRGVSRIPGKHGEAQRRWAELEVLVPDTPGELGRLFTELGSADINIEDLVLEHSAGKRFGSARIMVDPAFLLVAVEELEQRGWRIINSGE